MSYWTGDRETGHVRLNRCERCKKNSQVSVQARGPVPRKCDKCSYPRNTLICDRCGKAIVGRRRKYCTKMCRLAEADDRRKDPDKIARAIGNKMLRDRGGEIYKCQICNEPVDPRIPSRWGFREMGTLVHESAGSHPSATEVDGPSCLDILEEK